MKTGPDFGALLYCVGTIIFFIGLQRVLLIVKMWCVRRWRLTAGVVKDSMLVPHAELKKRAWSRFQDSFVAETQYVAVVNYTFHDGGIDREGRLLQRFTNKRAAHKFLAHFHTGQTVSVRHSSVWPYPSTLEFEPTILHPATEH